MATTVVQAASVQPPPPPVEDYGKLPGMEMVELSPSGQRYAFVATVGERRKLIVATAANEPLEVDDLGATKVERLEWAGDDHLLVTVSSTVHLGIDFVVDKTELDGVIVADLKHHKSFSVFGSPYERRVAHTVVGSYGSAQVDGHWYGYFGAYSYENDKGGGQLKEDLDGRLYPDLYRVDLDTGDISLAATGQQDTSDWLVSPTGEVVARLRYNQRSGEWRAMTSKWGGVELASGRSVTEGVSLLGLGRTPGTILLRIEDGEHNILKELPLAGGPPTATFDEEETGSPLFDPTTHLWIGSDEQNDDKTSNLFSPLQKAKLKGALKAFPGYLVQMISFSADFNRMIVFTDGGDDSGTYWIVDITKGSADVLGAPYPTVRAAQVGAVRWVDYKAADGLAMRGVLTLPPGRDPKGLPLVVMPHGGPEAHDYPRFDYWAQAFAARGYAVFQPNFRGSTGAGNAFRDAGLGQWGRKMQTDISDGVAELTRQGIVDPKRACIVGWSYGGYAALAGVTIQHGRYRCAVSMAGVSDLSAMLDYVRDRAGGVSSTTRYWKAFLGVTSTWQTELNDISPIRMADRADAPILLVHGQDDTVVPIEQSQSMDRALQRSGKPVEFLSLTGADHWLLHEDARVAMLKASVAFVLKNNPPDPAPATAVAAR
ncbi:MAG TPA: S9 family peptidase [Caulobacteraceae bacterium]